MKEDYQKLMDAAKAYQANQVKAGRVVDKSKEADERKEAAADAIQQKNDLEFRNYRLKSENQLLRHENKHLKSVLTKTLKATWSDSRPVMVSIRKDVQGSLHDVFQLVTQKVQDAEKYQEDGQSGIRM